MIRSSLALSLLSLLLGAACNDPMVVGSVHIKSGQIDAAAGGTLTITAADHPQLAGTSITIPPNALAASTRIAIGLSELSLAYGDNLPGGPALYFSPIDLQLRTPALVTIPYDAGAKADQLRIHAASGGPVQDLTSRIKQIDAGLVVVELDTLVHVQTFTPGCNNPMTCGTPGDTGTTPPDTGGGTVSCAMTGCPPGMTCFPAGCVAVCGNTTCPTGQGCNANTQCVQQCGSGGAITHLCDVGEVCDFSDGSCDP